MRYNWVFSLSLCNSVFPLHFIVFISMKNSISKILPSWFLFMAASWRQMPNAVVNSEGCGYFCKKHSLVDVWLSSKYTSGSLEAPCKMLPLNSFVLQCFCHKQFVFFFFLKRKMLHWKTLHWWFYKIYTHL